MKISIFEKPYLILWCTIPVLWVVTLFFPYETVDIQIHDTYIVILYPHLTLFWSTVLLVLGIVYWAFRNVKLIKWLTVFNISSTVLAAFITLLLPIPRFVSMNNGVVIQFDVFEQNYYLNIFFIVAIILWLLSLLFLFLNLIVSIFRKIKNT